MKSLLKLLFAFLFLSSILGCNKETMDSSNSDIRTKHITINSGQEYTLNLNAGGDEQGAGIKTQALNYEMSEVHRDKSTNFKVVYYYKSKKNFKGTDHVIFNVCNEDNGTGRASNCHILILYIDVE